MPKAPRIEIFRDSDNLYTRVAPRKRYALALVLAFLLVAAGNIWWLVSTHKRPLLMEELDEHGRSSALLRQSLERIESRFGDIEDGVKRLQGGDASIRKMISLDKEARKAVQGTQPQGQGMVGHEELLNRMEVQAAFIRAINRPVKLALLDTKDLHGLLAPAVPAIGAAPDAWPVSGVLSSDFGVRLSPFAGQEEFHKGVDIMAPAGSPVRAPAPGQVTFAGEDAEGTMAVVLDHGGGFVTTFSHMQRLEVAAGQPVARGEEIGAVGQEGRSTGPHLHYEVRLYGMPLNPKKFLP